MHFLQTGVLLTSAKILLEIVSLSVTGARIQQFCMFVMSCSTDIVYIVQLKCGICRSLPLVDKQTPRDCHPSTVELCSTCTNQGGFDGVENYRESLYQRELCHGKEDQVLKSMNTC